jgi:hypothetical protein
MELVLALVVLILAAAVVLLFAMLGELASRVSGTENRRPSQDVRPVPEARVGAEPTRWPAELAGYATADRALVVVLSTACGTCEAVAAQLVDAAAGDMAIVVSCASRESGEIFVERHKLTFLPHYVDVNGDWVQGETGVAVSPSGLAFHRGRLDSALTFADLSAWRSVVELKEKEVTR